MKANRGTVWINAGLLLIAAALFLSAYNELASYEAGKAQRSLAMEEHHRGSQRDIIPRPAAATLLFVLVTVFRFTL